MPTDPPTQVASREIPALRPRGSGQQFVVYGDACSGIQGHQHEKNFASVNAVIQRLKPAPEFILFTGDEIAGLTADIDELQAQWRYWLDHEMAWLDRTQIPLWQATGNHTTYDKMSEAQFREMLQMPTNGPAGQEGLSFFIRRENLLIVFAHTLWSDLGGEGYVETRWLSQVLQENADAEQKLVVGHHPVFPVNGFSGPIQREVSSEIAIDFWRVLAQNDVQAYICGHILAFDVQVHQGVLQICSAGAGTAYLMPKDIEYFHCLQMALDKEGLRYQVLDNTGKMRERLNWPIPLPAAEKWHDLDAGEMIADNKLWDDERQGLFLRIRGRSAEMERVNLQTLFCACHVGLMPSLWIGFKGPEQRLTVIIGPEPRRSPHYWLGPTFPAGEAFDFIILLHRDMGAGGILFQEPEQGSWTSLTAASPWGFDRLKMPSRWLAGHGSNGPEDQPFAGTDLTIGVASISYSDA